MNSFMLRIAALSNQQAVIGATFIALFWYLALFNDGSDLDRRLSDINTRLQAERALVVESEQALKEIKDLQTALTSLTDQFKLVSAQLPTDLQMAEVIRTVDKVAQATGITLKSKEPRPSQRQDTIETLPLKIVGQGGFNEIGMFFYYLSTIERIVRIRGYAIAAPEGKFSGGTLSLEAELVSYKFVPPTTEGGK